MEDMIEDIGQENLKSACVYDSLEDDSKKALIISRLYEFHSFVSDIKII